MKMTQQTAETESPNLIVSHGRGHGGYGKVVKYHGYIFMIWLSYVIIRITRKLCGK